MLSPAGVPRVQRQRRRVSQGDPERPQEGKENACRRRGDAARGLAGALCARQPAGGEEFARKRQNGGSGKKGRNDRNGGSGRKAGKARKSGVRECQPDDLQRCENGAGPRREKGVRQKLWEEQQETAVRQEIEEPLPGLQQDEEDRPAGASRKRRFGDAELAGGELIAGQGLNERERKSKGSRKRRFSDAGDAGGEETSGLQELEEREEKARESRKRSFNEITPTPASSSTYTAINHHKRQQPNPFPLPSLPTDIDLSTRPNPFDAPLPMVSTAAPVRSYRASQTSHHTTRSQPVWETRPIREQVCYADLWEGVSAISTQDLSSYNGQDGGAPMYDFLYDGVWKRRCAQGIVSVGKRRRVGWRGEGWYGGWDCVGVRVRFGGRGYKDLDRPNLDAVGLGIAL